MTWKDRHYSPQEKERIARAYENGEIIKLLAAELGRSYYAVCNYARRNNLRMTPHKNVTHVVPILLNSEEYATLKGSSYASNRRPPVHLRIIALKLIKEMSNGANNEQVSKHSVRTASTQPMGMLESGETS